MKWREIVNYEAPLIVWLVVGLSGAIIGGVAVAIFG